MKIAIEIKPGEGGEDARLLTETQAKIYLKYAEVNGLPARLLYKDTKG